MALLYFILVSFFFFLISRVLRGIGDKYVCKIASRIDIILKKISSTLVFVDLIDATSEAVLIMVYVNIRV